MSRYQAELLPNGLLRVWDYACKWGLLYHKDEKGKWEPHNANAMIRANQRILHQLNGGK